MYNWFTYERISLTSPPLLSFLVNPYLSCGGDCIFSPFSYLIPVSLNEVPWVALVWPDSCARVSLSKSSSKQRIRQRWGAAAAALLGGAMPQVRSDSPFYCTACSPGYCPPRVWWMTTTLGEPATGETHKWWICFWHLYSFISDPLDWDDERMWNSCVHKLFTTNTTMTQNSFGEWNGGGLIYKCRNSVVLSHQWVYDYFLLSKSTWKFSLCFCYKSIYRYYIRKWFHFTLMY